MDNLEQIIKTTLAEIEKILNTGTVMGEPVKVDGSTVIPLVKVGFGFGMGSGSGKTGQKEKDEGTGNGLGGGGGVKPVALIVADKSGVRIELLEKSKGSVFEKLSENLPEIIEKIGQKKEKSQKKD
jgi:uncharacterized spore protein YtfJ